MFRRNTFTCRLTIVPAVLLINACASSGGFPERPEVVEAKLSSLQQKYFLPAKDVLAEYSMKTDAADKRSYRDTVVHGRLLALDMQYGVFKEAVYEEGVVSNLTLDILGVAVGTAGAVTTATEASRILSALSGGISGTGTAIDKNLYYERTLPALIALMDSERDKVRGEILEGLTQEANIYPLGRALSDLERYLQVGSIPGALATVTSVAGKAKAEAEAKLEVVRKKGFVDPTAQERVDSLLTSVQALPSGAAWELLSSPPTTIDQFALEAVKARLGGIDLASAAPLLSGDDTNAKEILKMLIVLMSDRSADSVSKWTAAIDAKIR